jgi:hypothetical protein
MLLQMQFFSSQAWGFPSTTRVFFNMERAAELVELAALPVSNVVNPKGYFYGFGHGFTDPKPNILTRKFSK